MPILWMREQKLKGIMVMQQVGAEARIWTQVCSKTSISINVLCMIHTMVGWKKAAKDVNVLIPPYMVEGALQLWSS